jgi:hypothetical protein
MTSRRSSGLIMVAGALVWAIHFMASYGILTLVCVRGLVGVTWAGVGLVDWTMVTLTALALLTLGTLVGIVRRRDRFVDRIAMGVAGLAALAIAWEAWLVTRGPPCV